MYAVFHFIWEAQIEQQLLVQRRVSRNFRFENLCNGNGTEWNPVLSMITRVMTKSDNRAAVVQLVHHEYDYKQLLVEVLVICGTVNVEASVISLGLRPRLITLAKTLIIRDVTKASKIIVLLYMVL